MKSNKRGDKVASHGNSFYNNKKVNDDKSYISSTYGSHFVVPDLSQMSKPGQKAVSNQDEKYHIASMTYFPKTCQPNIKVSE